MPTALPVQQRDVSTNPLVLEYRICEAEKRIEDQEHRLRAVEDAVTKFNTIIWLLMGSGLLGLINLATLFFELKR